jgi:hypothetical protein
MIEFNYARRTDRRATDVPCDLVRRTWDEPIRHTVTEMSPHGVWIKTSFPLHVGEHVVLSFSPPKRSKKEELTVFARVIRSVQARESDGVRRGGMALQFVDLSKTERRTLQQSLRGLPTTRGDFGLPKSLPAHDHLH